MKTRGGEEKKEGSQQEALFTNAVLWLKAEKEERKAMRPCEPAVIQRKKRKRASFGEKNGGWLSRKI